MAATFAVTPEVTLGAPVANGGTISFPYPSGTSSSSSWAGSGHVLIDAQGNQYTSGFTVAFGSVITVTNSSLGALAAGRNFRLQANQAGEDSPEYAIVVYGAGGNITSLRDGSGAAIIFPRILAQSAIPFVLPSSGSIANNGALSGITALQTTYSGGCWMYFPAGAISAGSSAGWYWTVMSSTTAGTIYNSTYTSGGNFVGTATAFATTGPGAYVQSTSEIIGPSLTVPGRSLGPNGSLRIGSHFSYSNNANNKTFRHRLGGTSFQSGNATTNVGLGVLTHIFNKNSASVQHSVNGNNGAYSVSAGQVVFGTVNTDADQSVSIGLQLAVATDFLTCEGFAIEVLYGA